MPRGGPNNTITCANFTRLMPTPCVNYGPDSPQHDAPVFTCRIWLGLHDDEVDSVFRRQDAYISSWMNPVFTFAGHKWENCIAWSLVEGEWTDESCSASFEFYCEEAPLTTSKNAVRSTFDTCSKQQNCFILKS